MIEFTKSYRVGDKVFATIEEAQAEEISILLNIGVGSDQIAMILKHRDALVDILTTTKSSRPRGRKSNGATKKRKATTEAALAKAA